MSIRDTDPGRRAFLGLARGVLRKVDDGKKMQEVQVEVLKGDRIDGIEHWHGYGFSSAPQAGAEALVAFVGGNHDHPIVIAIGDRRYRMKVADGEVALHDDQGQSVHLTRDGVVVTSGAKVTVNAPAVNLGGEGGSAVLTEGGTATKVFAV